MSKIDRIFIFGDSIGQGFYDEKNGGWVQQLQRYFFKEAIEEKSDVNIINLSVSGHSSTEVLARIHFEISNRIRPVGMLTILAIGVNDSYEKHGIKRTPPEKLNENINQIIQEVKALGSELLILGCTPCVNDRVQPTSWNSALWYDTADLRKYESILQRCAADADVEFLPLWEALNSKMQDEELMPDGIHPNTTGHEIIYNEVSRKLRVIMETSR
jgi:lysophospholipase L1-like esterase